MKANLQDTARQKTFHTLSDITKNQVTTASYKKNKNKKNLLSILKHDKAY